MSYRSASIDGVQQRLLADGRPLSFREVLTGWRDDPELRLALREALRAAGDALRWECPGLTEANLDAPYAHAIVPAPELVRPADPSSFAPWVTGAAPDRAASFSNLGHDAILVVPTPPSGPGGYAHLGAFVQGAPEAAWHALWAEVGRRALARVGARPVWINTAGAGVPWLHVRLDDRPKYYHYGPYRTAPG